MIDVRELFPQESRFLLAAGLAALCSLALSGCGGGPPQGGGSGAAPSAQAGYIPIGSYASVTGTRATFGQATNRGVELAIEEINAAGGVLGKPLKLFVEDDQSRQEEVPAVVAKLINQNKVVVVIGEVASSCSLAAAPICQRERVPMITPSSTNPRVTQVGDYIFRMCYLDDFQGAAMARFAYRSLGAKRAAIFRDIRNAYSVGLADFFSAEFQKLGGTIVADDKYSEGDADYRAQLTKIKSTNPDCIFVPGYYADAAKIAKQSRDLGITAPQLGGDGWESPRLLEIGGKALDGAFYGNHYFPGDPRPSVANFREKFIARYHDAPEAFSGLGYDSAMLAADAIRRAGTTDGPALRDALASTKNWTGVTGTMSFDANRNPVKSIAILAIQNGAITLRDEIAP